MAKEPPPRKLSDADQLSSPELTRSSRRTFGQRIPWTSLAWAWSSFIVLICLAPHNPGTPSALPWDKWAHFVLFALFGGLWSQASPRQWVRIAIAGTLLGLGIEVAQSTLGWGRMGDGMDFFADCLGLVSGLVAARINEIHKSGKS